MFFSDRFLIEWCNRRHFFTKSRPPPRKRGGRIGGNAIRRDSVSPFLLIRPRRRAAQYFNCWNAEATRFSSNPIDRLPIDLDDVESKLLLKAGMESSRIISLLKTCIVLFSRCSETNDFEREISWKKFENSSSENWMISANFAKTRNQWSVILCKACAYWNSLVLNNKRVERLRRGFYDQLDPASFWRASFFYTWLAKSTNRIKIRDIQTWHRRGIQRGLFRESIRFGNEWSSIE